MRPPATIRLPSAPSFAWQRYTKHGIEATPEQVDAGKKMEEKCKGEEKKKMCTFYFVSAKFIKETYGNYTTLPKLQELKEITTLEEHTVRLEDACRQQLSRTYPQSL